MRATLTAALIVVMGAVLSCADMPLGPRSMVTLKGSVLDRDGAPLRGARVSFISLDQRPESPNPGPYTPPLGTADTDADGAFALQLPEGEYMVRIDPPYNTGTGFPGVIIPRLEVDGGRRLDYRYSGILVSGRIIGPSGSTPPQAFVAAYSREGDNSAYTQSKDGAYGLLLPSGQYRFYAYPQLYSAGLPQLEFEATIPPRDTTIDLDFSGHEIKVAVTFQGVPLINAGVSARMQGVFAGAATDIDGVATLYLPTGGYTFRVYMGAAGMTGPEERYQSVQSDATFSFDLTGVVWRVTLRRQVDLSPIPQASVFVHEIGGIRYGQAQSDLEGQFRMVVQPNTWHDIQITLPSQASTYVVNGVESSADSTFDLLIPAPPIP